MAEDHVGSVHLELAREERALVVTRDRVRWAGPIDAEADAPIVACELPVTLDARAIAELVARAPIPSTLLHELAAHCPPGEDDANADPRWRRARMAAAIARGDRSADVRDESGTCIDRGVLAMRVLPDGRLVRVRESELTRQLVIGDAAPIALPVPERALYTLPAPLAMDPDQVVVTIYTAERTTLIAFDGGGRELARVEGAARFLPDRVSHGRAGYWVHNDDYHQLLGGTAPVERRPYVRGGETVAGRWLLAIERGRELAWLSLDTVERRGFGWRHEPRAIVRVDDVLWCTTSVGLWRLRGGEPPELVREGEVNGLAVDATHVWLGMPRSSRDADVVAIELGSGAELWRTRIAHDAWALYRFETCILAGGFGVFTCLAPDGGILATPDARRDLGVAQLGDGTVAASCGEQVVIVDPAGSVRRALPMPYDGQIVGATRDRFLFGPVSGGVDQVRPTALVAFDRTGRVTARLVPPSRPMHVGDTRVYARPERAYDLVEWDPHGTTTGVAAPAPRMPTERGARRIGSTVINPRDDWPEVGIEVHADFLALDGTYGGSSGQSSEVALRVGDGAIATFVRCDLTIGGSGSIVQRASTVFMIDCKLPAAEWSIGSACHVVILGGEVSGELRIHAAPTASVLVDGSIVRRAGDVYVVTSAARGAKLVVEGVTYAWEKDERSGALSYTSRRKMVSYIHVTAEDGSAISFELPDGDLQVPGWWGSTRVTPEVIERAIRIAARRDTRPYLLAADEVREAFDGSVRTLEDQLVVARAALDGLTRPDPDNTRVSFIRSMLAAGCCGTDADREAIADWVASHADVLRAARAGLQLILDEMRSGEYLFANRSAIAFLIDMCARVRVDLELDTTSSDAALRERFRRSGPVPWGIPPSHWWWDQPSEEPEDALDPHF